MSKTPPTLAPAPPTATSRQGKSRVSQNKENVPASGCPTGQEKAPSGQDLPPLSKAGQLLSLFTSRASTSSSKKSDRYQSPPKLSVVLSGCQAVLQFLGYEEKLHGSLLDTGIVGIQYPRTQAKQYPITDVSNPPLMINISCVCVCVFVDCYQIQGAAMPSFQGGQTYHSTYYSSWWSSWTEPSYTSPTTKTRSKVSKHGSIQHILCHTIPLTSSGSTVDCLVRNYIPALLSCLREEGRYTCIVM